MQYEVFIGSIFGQKSLLPVYEDAKSLKNASIWKFLPLLCRSQLHFHGRGIWLPSTGSCSCNCHDLLIEAKRLKLLFCPVHMSSPLPPVLISQLDLPSKFRWVIVHQQLDYGDEKWGVAPHIVLGGLNHPVITNHARRDLIKMAAVPRSPLTFIGKQGRWERRGQWWREK